MSTSQSNISESNSTSDNDEFSFLSGHVRVYYEELSEEEPISIAVAESSADSRPSMYYGTESSASRSNHSNNSDEDGWDLFSTSESFQIDDDEEEAASVQQDFDREIVFSSKSPPSSTSPKRISNSSIRERLNDSMNDILGYVESAGIERWIQRKVNREYRRYRRLVNSAGPMRLSNNTAHRLSKYSPNKSPIRADKLRFTPVAHIPTTPTAVYMNRGTKLKFTPLAHFSTTPMHLYQYQAPDAAGYPATDNTRQISSSNKPLRAVGGTAKTVMKPRRLLYYTLVVHSNHGEPTAATIDAEAEDNDPPLVRLRMNHDATSVESISALTSSSHGSTTVQTPLSTGDNVGNDNEEEDSKDTCPVHVTQTQGFTETHWETDLNEFGDGGDSDEEGSLAEVFAAVSLANSNANAGDNNNVQRITVAMTAHPHDTLVKGAIFSTQFIMKFCVANNKGNCKFHFYLPLLVCIWKIIPFNTTFFVTCIFKGTKHNFQTIMEILYFFLQTGKTRLFC
eukprot:jgi/Psemu1/34647/gm1.34647_g